MGMMLRYRNHKKLTATNKDIDTEPLSEPKKERKKRGPNKQTKT